MKALHTALCSSGVPVVTANEVAEFVYCPHAWYLKQQAAPITEEARRLRQEGRLWQDKMDAIIPAALHTQQQAERKLHQATTVLWACLMILGIVVLYLSFSSSH